ncbi:MAG: alpha amylase C-terminal domain-containing protein [Planctomycetaceae bacterium]|nr:alpha amylase C-terminal domain-containing protein [Planctomycetaceae bacterium]
MPKNTTQIMTPKTSPKISTAMPPRTPRLSARVLASSLLGAALTSSVALSAAAPLFAQSTRPGMGATPYFGTPAGTTFRVWAPNATAVRVAGTFNNWNSTSHPLVSEGNGHWSADVNYCYAGAQYKFVITGPAGTVWKNDARARQLTSSVGNSIVVNPNAYNWQVNNFQIPSWNELVVYELHIGTFGQTPKGTVPANLDQAKAKLDHLADLGVNAVQVMPFWEFPQNISWGYNGSHPYAIESAYGTPTDLKEFVDAAHARGIAVFSDLVFNHLGPNDLDLWQYDGWSQNNGGGIFFFQDSRANTPWGNTRPDYGRGEVRQYIRDNVLYWLGEYRLDGHRMDGTKYIRKVDQAGPEIPEGWSLLQWINDSVNQQFPEKISICEDLDNNAWLTKTTGAGGAGFDSQWDAQFYWPVRGNLITQNDADRDMWAIRNAITANYNADAFQRVVYTESHDEVANGQSRMPEAIWPGNAGSWYSKKRSTLGAAVVMTSPGIPMLFQGQEFLEDGWFQDTDPVDWSKKTTYAGINALYKDLIKLRKNETDLTRGLTGQSTNVHHVNNSWKVLGFHRWMNGGEKDDVIVVMNFSATPRTGYRMGFPRDGRWKVRFNSDWNGYSADFANTGTYDLDASYSTPWDGMPASGIFDIGAYSCVIFSQGDPPPPTNPADINGDGTVNAADLAVLLSAWGTANDAADLNNNGTVEAADLAQLLAQWGWSA